MAFRSLRPAKPLHGVTARDRFDAFANQELALTGATPQAAAGSFKKVAGFLQFRFNRQS